MKPTRNELRGLVIHALAGALLLAAGAGLVWGSGQLLVQSRSELAAARRDHAQSVERLARIADEEREVREKAEIYLEMKKRGILGEERRLDWADALKRIHAGRELLDLRYRIEKRRTLGSIAGQPPGIDVYASSMNAELRLLHEGDLLRFLSDLRESGNAYYAPRRCRVERLSGAPRGAAGLAPRLGAQCEIDLITVVDRGAKK